MQQNISDLRREFSGTRLDESNVPNSPIQFFKLWLDQALESNIADANAFTLATIDKDLQPQARVLLLKDYHADGFIFYTNQASDKGKQIEYNNKACMLFFWQDLFRQVRINGKIEKIDDKIAQQYFATRPKASKIGALASNQSQIITKQELEKKYAELEKIYADTEEVPKPKTWGGYMLKPDYYEFWQGQAGRFHDRICYKSNGYNRWDIYRISP